MRVRPMVLLGIVLLLALVQSANQSPVDAQPTCTADCGGGVIVCGANNAVCTLGIQCKVAGPMDCCLACTDGKCRNCLRT
jgi:hypothetical protein